MEDFLAKEILGGAENNRVTGWRVPLHITLRTGSLIHADLKVI